MLEISFVRRRILYSLGLFGVSLFLPLSLGMRVAPGCDFPCGTLSTVLLSLEGWGLVIQPVFSILAYLYLGRTHRLDEMVLRLILISGLIVLVSPFVVAIPREWSYAATISMSPIEFTLRFLAGFFSGAFFLLFILVGGPAGWSLLASIVLLLALAAEVRDELFDRMHDQTSLTAPS